MTTPSIPVAFVANYADQVYVLAQQMASKFDQYTRQDPNEVNAKRFFFERIGTTTARRRTTRHGDTPVANTPHSRRGGTLFNDEWADLIDKEDAGKMLIAGSLPSSYRSVAGAALMRARDETIRDALQGNAYSFDEDDASSTVALPAAQKISAGGAGLTLTKLNQAREIFELADIDADDVIPFAVSPKQMTNLLATTEIKSADYNSVKALVEGRVDTFMRFKFINTNRLTLTSTTRQCLAWHPSGVGRAVNPLNTFGGGAMAGDLYVSMSIRNDKADALQVYVAQAYGATRIEDAKVVQVDCTES
jgi:hypothetical protein